MTFPSLADDAVVLQPWTVGDVPQQLTAFADPVFTTCSDGCHADHPRS
jgi:hypothetical protein